MPRGRYREGADAATAQGVDKHPNRAPRLLVVHSRILAARSDRGVRVRFSIRHRTNPPWRTCSLRWIASWRPAKRPLRFGCVQARLLPLLFLSARSRPLAFLPCLLLPKRNKTLRLFHERRTVAIIPNDMICALDFLLERHL